MGLHDEIVIPVIPGDGVGPELVKHTRQCLDAIGDKTGLKFKYIECLAGYAAYSKTGNSLPEETVTIMKKYPVTLMGGISSKNCPAPSPMGQMRKALGLFADIRHCFSVPGSLREGIDIVVVRECSEGFLQDRNMYSGCGEFMPTPDVVLSMRVITKQKCEQIAQVAYEYAKKHNRKRVTIGHKKVVFTMGCGMFRDKAFEKAALYPEIITDEEHVDILAGCLVSHPEEYDVILTTNLFGDILSDVVAAQVGSSVPIINASGTNALFYPSHGAIKNYAEKECINPMAMFYTISAMLHWLELTQAGDILDKALASCSSPILGKSMRLPDGMTTSEVAGKVLEAIIKEGGDNDAF